MSSDPSPKQASSQDDTLNQGLVRVQQRLEQLTRAQSAIRLWTVVVVLILVAQSLLFAWALYGTVQRNFLDKDRVMTALTPRLEALYPSFRNEGTNILFEVGPVYKDLAMVRFQAAAPQLIEGFEKELRQLAVEIPNDTRKSLDISLNRVAKRLEPDIRATFPALADPAALDRLTKQFETRVYEEFGKIGLKLDTMYQAESRKIWNAMVALSPAPQFASDKVDLERNLLHHLIMLADHELLNAGEPDSSTEVFLKLFDTGDPHAIPSAN